MTCPTNNALGTPSASTSYLGEPSTSRNLSEEEKPVITKEMELEEKRMEEENAKEAERIKKQFQEELKAQEELEKEAKYNRLKHLLEPIKLHTESLVKKIEASKAANAKRNESKKKSEEKKKNLESRSLKERNGSVPVESSAKDRKRKTGKNTNSITDVIDEEEVQDAKGRRMESDDVVKKPEESEVPAGTHRLEVPENQPNLFEGGVLRDYQLQGLEWLKAMFENGVNGILADEMGLGKTIQVISLLCHLIEKNIPGPFLIVAPLSTLPNWSMEFNRFAPQIPVVIFHGSKDERRKMYEQLAAKIRINHNITVAPVVLTSYQIPLKEETFMSRLNWTYIIVDEGHALKCVDTQISRCLRGFTSINRLLVTGTPLQNNLTELWALLNYLMPEVFDDLHMFQALFDIEAINTSEDGENFLRKEAESHILSILHKVLTPFLLRRLKSDVELNLPSKKEVLVHCPITDLQLELYKATLNKDIDILLKKKAGNAPEPVDLNTPRKKRKCAEKKKDYTFKKVGRYEDVATAMEPKVVEEPKKQPTVHTTLRMACPEMQLRKIADHPYLLQMPIEAVNGEKVMVGSEELVTVSGKMLVLNALLLKLRQQGHKVLIFSFFKIMLNLIEEFAVIRNYPYVRLDGDDQMKDRKVNINTFNTNPDIFLFLISKKAGGVGLNLTSADTVILFDSDYNPQVDLQAMDRCHRIGQKKPVIVYRFISKGTVDEKILQTANGKRKLGKMVIKKDCFKLSSVKKRGQADELEELKQLLESAEHHKAVHANGLVFTDKELAELLDRNLETSAQGSHFVVVKSEPAT